MPLGDNQWRKPDLDLDETDGMSCTIVIPHKDRLAHLTWCLRALKNQITQTPFEVIVVDDGSKVLPVNGITPGNFPENIRFINQNNKGAASARNAGWMASEQDFIIFLDCDQIVSPRFVQNHLITFQQTQAHVMQLGTRRHLKPNLKIDLKTVRDEKCYPDERLFFFRKASWRL
jgi:glycosyltransferase involved in cell wall biosynthesis